VLFVAAAQVVRAGGDAASLAARQTLQVVIVVVAEVDGNAAVVTEPVVLQVDVVEAAAVAVSAVVVAEAAVQGTTQTIAVRVVAGVHLLLGRFDPVDDGSFVFGKDAAVFGERGVVDGRSGRALFGGFVAGNGEGDVELVDHFVVGVVETESHAEFSAPSRIQGQVFFVVLFVVFLASSDAAFVPVVLEDLDIVSARTGSDGGSLEGKDPSSLSALDVEADFQREVGSRSFQLKRWHPKVATSRGATGRNITTESLGAEDVAILLGVMVIIRYVRDHLLHFCCFF